MTVVVRELGPASLVRGSFSIGLANWRTGGSTPFSLAEWPSGQVALD